MTFIFDGQSLEDFGYIMLSDGDSQEENMAVSKMGYVNTKVPMSDVSHVVATSYEERLTRTILIVKNPCVFGDNLDLTNDDISEMSKWLCRKTYKWFRYYDEDDLTDEVWYKVMCTIDKKEMGDTVVGLIITITADAPYGYTKEIVNTWTFPDITDPWGHPDRTSSYTIDVHSDEEGYIYPDITITISPDQLSQDFTITNTYDGRQTKLGLVVSGDTFQFLGGDVQQLIPTFDSEAIYVRDISHMYNYKQPRLCNQYNNYANTFTVNCGCSVEMKYRGIRKVGL